MIVIPAVLTFWVFYFIIQKLNFLLLDPIAGFLNRWLPIENIEVLSKIAIFFLVLILLVLIGFAARIILIRNIFGFGEKILYRVPMISTVYRTIKEISLAFFIQKNTIFKRAVLIEYPRKGLYQLGFVVSEPMGEVQEKTKENIINVFVPTTPNPTSGMLVLVPKEEVMSLGMSIPEAMKMIISGGAVFPKNHNGYSKDRGATA
ncbi:MAG: DUF502 domain-containing protein [Candidatus Omnitrophota bacterium]